MSNFDEKSTHERIKFDENIYFESQFFVKNFLKKIYEKSVEKKLLL